MTGSGQASGAPGVMHDNELLGLTSHRRVEPEAMRLSFHSPTNDTLEDTCVRVIWELFDGYVRGTVASEPQFCDVYSRLLDGVGNDPDGEWRARLSATIRRLRNL